PISDSPFAPRLAWVEPAPEPAKPPTRPVVVALPPALPDGQGAVEPAPPPAPPALLRSNSPMIAEIRSPVTPPADEILFPAVRIAGVRIGAGRAGTSAGVAGATTPPPFIAFVKRTTADEDVIERWQRGIWARAGTATFKHEPGKRDAYI